MPNKEARAWWSRRGFLGFGAVLAAAGLGRPRAVSAHNLPSGQFGSAAYDNALAPDGAYKAVFQSPHIDASLQIEKRLDHLLLLQAKNWLNTFQFSYNVSPEDLRIVVATYASANLLSYGDTVWQKYRLGEKYNVIDPVTAAPATRNLFRPSRFLAGASTDPDNAQSVYQDAGIEALQKRGVLFLT